jgi:hypothetical protein
MSRIAFLTFGVLIEPWGDRAVAGFEERLDRTFDAADANPGFISRSLDYEPTPTTPTVRHEWGPYRRSTLYPGVDDPDQDTEAATLSLWRDLEPVHAFAYSSFHLQALRQRADWFEPRRWPTYVAWWVSDDKILGRGVRAARAIARRGTHGGRLRPSTTRSIRTGNRPGWNAVSLRGLRLADLQQVAVRVTEEAADLPVGLHERREEDRATHDERRMGGARIGNPDGHRVADPVRV